jgi:hypothetical protein
MDKGCVSGSTGTSFKHTEIRESRDSMLVSEELWSKLASVDLISNTKEVNKQLGTHSVNQHTPEQNCMLDLTELSSKNSQVSP